jgi:hypothetical protein
MTQQPEPENLPQSLMRSAATDQTASVLIEFSESVLDDATEAALQSDVLTKIPVLGGIVALTKGVLGFRERRYISKLANFLAETGKASAADKAKYLAKLDANPKECKKAGGVILDLIDKITSTEKAAMIGKIFHAHMREDEITTAHVIMLSEMVEKAYLSDLLALARPDGAPGERWNDANLESVGIKKPMRVEDVNKAVSAAMSRMLKQMPMVHEAPIDDSDELVVLESGFTDQGALLQRILREY